MQGTITKSPQRLSLQTPPSLLLLARLQLHPAHARASVLSVSAKENTISQSSGGLFLLFLAFRAPPQHPALLGSQLALQ